MNIHFLSIYWIIIIGLYYFVNSHPIQNTNTSNNIEIITLKKNNFIRLEGEINDNNVAKWIRNMNKISLNKIYIYINSSGGNVDSGLQFINTMNWYIQNNKIIICIGKKAHSMAFVIFQHCTQRYIISSSILMQHQISISGTGIKGPINNILNYLDMVQSIGVELDIKIASRLGMQLSDYKNKISNDWWLYGNSILQANAADKLVIVGCDAELYNIIIKKKEEIFIDISIGGNFKFDKIDSTNDLCPL